MSLKKYFLLLVVLAFMLTLQSYLSSRARETFYQDVEQDVEQMEERMRRDGISPEQIRHNATVLNNMKTNVSSYVSEINNLSTFNTLLYIALFAIGIDIKLKEKS